MELPNNAKLICEGKFIQFYQRDQQLANGLSTTFEFAKIPGSVVVIPVVDGKIGMVHETQVLKGTYYGFFGGYLFKEEDPLVAAKRELKEESGLYSDNWEFFTSFEKGGSLVGDTRNVFIAKNCYKVGDIELDGGEEFIEPIWLDFDEFIDLVIYERYKGESIKYRGKDLQHQIMKLKLNNQLENLKLKLLN